MASDIGYFHSKPSPGDQFMIEDILDFSHHHDSGAFDILTAGNSKSNSVDSSSSSVDITPFENSNSNSSFSYNNNVNLPPASDFTFAADLCVPHDDLAELEWLSNFVDEESFSDEDLHKLHLISGMSPFKSQHDDCSDARFYHHHDPPRAQSPVFSPVMPVPGKARSKRSRAARANWASHHLFVSPTAQPSPPDTLHSEAAVGSVHDPESGGGVRKCLHCATEKTPQWRAGPMGPKTLCNACGVRYKSGRLVPEYRPASSPTFVQTKHSNSHRKVVELRRQKELMIRQHHSNGGMVFDTSDISNEYLIHHQQIGSDFRQII